MNQETRTEQETIVKNYAKVAAIIDFPTPIQTHLGRVDMLLTGFLKQGQGYTRFEEHHSQRAYTEEELRAALVSSGFHDIQVYEAFTRNPPTDKAERLQFTARKE